MKTAIFDIESGPLPLEKLGHLTPEFTAPANYKDPEKIAANIAAQRDAWLDKAALSAITGRVLCVGALKPDGTTEHLFSDDESKLLESVWLMLLDDVIASHWIGHNIFAFDLPFLVRRSRILNVFVPLHAIRPGRYWSDRFIDTMQEWDLGTHERISLDNLARCMGCGAKPEGVTGKDFARLWVEDKPQALAYLDNDLRMTAAVAARMGLCELNGGPPR